MTTTPRDQDQNPIPALYPLPSSTIVLDFGAVSAATAALPAGTYRFWSSEPCFIDRGANPVATASTTPVGKEAPEYFGIKAGDKVAAIQATAAGKLYLTPAE